MLEFAILVKLNGTPKACVCVCVECECAAGVVMLNGGASKCVWSVSS